MRALLQFTVATALALTACQAAQVVGDAGRDVGPTDSNPTDSGGSASDLISLRVEPVMTDLVSRNGDRITATLRAVGTRRDGMTVDVPAANFTLEDTRIGDITGAGVFTANGIAGGTVLVHAEALGPMGAMLRGDGSIHVRVEREALPAGAPADIPAHFEGSIPTDTAREANVLYPLDGVVMPNNVAPPDVQWERGDIGDVFRIHITKADLDLRAYAIHDGASFRFDHTMDRALWRSVAETDPSDAATLTVDRWIAATSSTVAGTPIHIRLTQGGIFGAVYYFTFSGASIAREMQIDPDTATRRDLVPNPPPSPVRGDRCLGCHTVSRDGRYLATALSGGVTGSAVFDLTRDLSGDPPPTEYPVAAIANQFFFTFNPDSSRLLTASGSFALNLYDPHTGSSVAATGLPTANATHPEWSPDDSAIAYVHANDGSGDLFHDGDIAILPHTSGDAFGSTTMIHRGADLASAVEGGNCDSHPTWSPDSRNIVFQHGTSSYSGSSDVNINNPSPYPGALYLVPRAGGTPVRLDRATGGATISRAYWPTFSPFVTVEPGEARGVYWLAFNSRQDYGNASAGTRGTNRLQIWVTAINVTPAAGEDPSSTPYWLPGQDVAQGNLGAYWAATPCRANGSTCTVSSECCSGRCLPDPAMPSRTICSPPPSTECRRRGQTCGGDGDCCSGLACGGNVCDIPPG